MSIRASTVILSEWISRTIDEVDRTSTSLGAAAALAPGHRKSMILCSDDYLLTALRVSLSLADSICRAEEEGAKLPTPSTNWSEAITINLNQTHNFDGTFIENGEPEKYVEAQFLPSLYSENGDGPNHSSSIQRIYSLGLVLYEIFSGGERPAELTKGEQKSAFGSEELLEAINFEPLPFDQVQPFELSDELGAIDGLLEGVDNEDNQSLPKKRQSQQSNNTNAFVSTDDLKSKWIPGPLCDMIANMLDSTNGALVGEDSYDRMADVRDDLQLMLEKPGIFLYDQDMGKLSVTGLQLSGTMYGRDEELSSMKEAYRRSIVGDGELVILSGPSGSGKSLLAHEFGTFVSASGGIVLSGKFDQLQQGKPFSALASAFDIYCGNLLNDPSSSSTMKVLASKLLSSLGSEAYHLTKMIPNLALILGPDVFDMSQIQVCEHPQERLQYLLCQFVEVISSSCVFPVTLFLDDLQWADPASMAAVSQLLFTVDVSTLTASKRCKQVFFVGCCREGTINKGHPVRKVFAHAKLLGVKYTDVKLRHFEEDTLNAMVAETLRLLPRLTRSLSSIIYHKTKGNAFFVARLMHSLSKQGLLRPSLSRRRWEWDVKKIQSQKLPDDVAIFITDSIEALSEDVKFSICVLSCFGASIEIAVIKTLEKALKKNMVDNLDIAVNEGLLDKTDGQYRFSHDRIQEAAYSMMKAVDRCHFHFFYGIALAKSATGEDESNLLTAANQVNLAGPEAVKDKSHYAVVANLNLRAGKKAMEMSDFVAAYSYFDNGITFLRKKHWEEHYALSLELFDLAAKCALTNGDMVSLQLLYEQVLAYGKSFEDKLNVTYLYTCSLAFSSKLPEAIEKGLDTLSKLGIELRGQDSSTEACVGATKDLLLGFTDDGILNTRRMTNPTMIIAMKFLGKLEAMMFQIMPKSVIHVTKCIIQLSLLHGMSPVSPIGFMYFGSYMAKLGDIRGGYHYVKLAHQLLDKVESRESAGEVFCFGTHIRAFVEPLQATLKYHDEGYAAAMASGDIYMAGGNLVMEVGSGLFAGVNLQTLRERSIEVTNFMYKRKLLIFFAQTQSLQRSVFKLIGSDEEPKYIAEGRDILATNNSVMTTEYFQQFYISFIFRSYDGTRENVAKYLGSIGKTWSGLVVQHAFHAYYIGLVSFWFARKEDSHVWQERGKISKSALRKWTESSLWTFEDKYLLLEAEEAFCNNDFEAAKTYYDKAIASANAHKFLNHEALACELAGYFYLDLGQKDKALELFLQAHEKYREWGAVGKCSSLFDFVASIFILPCDSGLSNTDSNGQNTTALPNP